MVEICHHNDCTGCTACASVCPKHAILMEKDEWGFPRPQIDASLCVDCGGCRKVCPALQLPQRKERLPEELFYAAYHKDESVRMQSSSGGAFSALASTVLRRGGVVCAAAFDESYKSVRHIIITAEEELPALRASKYLQSDMSGVMQAVREKLRAGREVLFVGTPCQVAGLHMFLKKEYETLTTVDIVCHGVPSPRIYQDYVAWLEHRRGSRLTGYTFRDKRWSWWRFNMKAAFLDGGAYYGKWESDPYYRGFLNDYFLRECCYSCKFSKHERYSDITLSDFWGYSATDGGFPDDDKGISMCMCNTVKGQNLFHQSAQLLEYCPRPREMSLANGGFSPREQNLETRAVFLRHYENAGFQACIKSHFKKAAVSMRHRVIYACGRESRGLRFYDKMCRIAANLFNLRAYKYALLKRMGKKF